MNRAEAIRLTERAKPEEVIAMLSKARKEITDWECRSHINPLLSRGAAFNIFAACKINSRTPVLAITNMIYEFGEYFPGYERPDTKHRNLPAPMHQEPMEFPQKEQ